MAVQKLEWLEVYSKEELKSFIEELIHELNYDFNQGEEELDRELAPEERWMITVYEWWRSAIAIQNPELEEAFEEDTEEIILTMPTGDSLREVVEQKREVIDYIYKKSYERTNYSSGNIFADLGLPDAEERHERTICMYQGA